MASRRARRVRLVASALAAATGIGALSSAALASGVFRSYQDLAADALVSTGPADPRVAVVGIDEQAQSLVGATWPWPRDVQARLVRRLVEAGAEVVVYDVALTSSTSMDAALVEAARGTRMVYAVPVKLKRQPGSRLLLAGTANRPVAPFNQACLGHAGITQDPGDGVVRSVPLLVEDPAHRFLPSLALAALLCGNTGSQPVVRPHGLQVGDRYIPTQSLQRLRVRYSDKLGVPAQSAYLSAASVLAGPPGVATLRGKTVFVGVTDPTLGDVHLVPGHKTAGLPGVFIHANALNTILQRSFLRDVSHREAWLAVMILALLIALLSVLLRPWALLGALVTTGAGYLTFALYEASRGVVVQLVWPSIAAMGSLLTALALRYLLEERQRIQVSGLFAQYVPPTVVEALLDSGRTPSAVAGERLEVTVLFCDLRGFTALAATLEPAQVRSLLDVYYRRATDLVHQHGGTLMQYVGDEVFAVFGAPLPMADAACMAFDCAVGLQRARRDLADELGGLGIPPVSFGIGLHAGEVIAAHVGGDDRRQYAVVGTTVNIGARLCSSARAGEIAMSAAVRAELADDCAAVDAGPQEFKGVASVHVWRVLSTDP